MDERSMRRVVSVGDLVVDAGARTVERDGHPIHVTKLSFDLLLALIEAAPEALSTEALMDRVWEDRVVSPATVAKRVEMLRQALSDDAGDPRYVVLVHGYGYRLATPEPMERPAETKAAALPVRETQSTRRFRSRGTLMLAMATLAALFLLFLPKHDDPPPPERSIAVLPFESLSDAPEDRWFAEGLAEEIGHSLARTGDLLVAGQTSTLAYGSTVAEARGVGTALGVAHLLTGTVRREGERVRIVTRLTATADGFQLWSEAFDETMEDALAAQRKIAERVAGQLLGRDAKRDFPDPAASSSSPQAYALYLQAVSLSPYPSGPKMGVAQALIERVVELDPGFALGWTRLAAIHGRRLYFDPAYPLAPDESIRIIREAVDRALAIDPTIGESYANLAGLAWAFDQDLARTAGLLEQAVRLDPWNLQVLGLARDFMRAIGDLEGSRDLGAYILRRDPLCVSCRTQYAGTLECLGDFEAAERQTQVVEDIAPGYPVAGALGNMSLARGDLAEAESRYARAEDPLQRLAGRALLQHARGDTAAARRSLAQLMEGPDSYWSVQSTTAAALGKKALALEALRRGMQSKPLFVQGTICAPDFDPLRDDPQWQELMLALGRNADGSQAVSFEMPPLPGSNIWRLEQDSVKRYP